MANEKKSSKWGLNYTLLKADPNRDPATAARKTIYQVGLGVGGGTLGTVLCGKYALLVGAVLAFTGNVWEEATALNPVGLGMMAASLNQPAGDTTIKQRWENVKSNLLSQTFLDKIKSKTGNKSKEKSIENKEQTDNGAEEKTDTPIGAVSPSNPEDALNQVEEDLVHSAMNHFNDNSASGSKAMGKNKTVYTSNADVDFSGM